MKRTFLMVALCTWLFTLCAKTGNHWTNTSVTSPDVNWIKAEVNSIFENKRSVNGEILADILTVDWNQINAATLVIASGQFTDLKARQLLITVPANPKKDQNLGWETNLWLLVQLDSNGYHTKGSIRGDVAYQNAVIDMDGDGYDEISMVNHVQVNSIEKVAYKLYSFNTQSLLYVSESQDRWTNNKDELRKTLKKGDLLYNVLETQFVDIDSDGKMEIVEKWIEFRYNGGKSVKDIEMKKTMKIRSRILTLKENIYQ